MKIVLLDAYTANPGDLDWSPFEAIGECSIHDRTPVAFCAAIGGRHAPRRIRQVRCKEAANSVMTE